jgi:hypothetical protein
MSLNRFHINVQGVLKVDRGFYDAIILVVIDEE